MLDKQQEARSLIDQALSVAPDDPYAYYIDGLILLRSGDAEGALGSLELAASMGYSLEMLAAEPHLATLRDDARFMVILATTKPL
jgi:lipoprotein NlpI